MNVLSIAIVLVGWVTFTKASSHFVNCLEDPSNHLKECDNGAICAWNKCNCQQGRKGCTLVCTNKIKQWCNGLSEGDRCIASKPQWECVKYGKKMTCLQNPLGPVCVDNGNAYYEGQSYMNDCNSCQCVVIGGAGVSLCTSQECTD